MSIFLENLEFIIVSIALVAVSYKWTGINPHRIEGGPSWLGAITTGAQATFILILALALIDGSYKRTASFFYYYACGSVLAPAFWTSFSPSPEEEPNPFLRWWKAKLNGIGDGMFKSMVTIPLAALVGFFVSGGALFWVTLLLATALSIGKMSVTLAMLGTDADIALLRERRKVLILGNVIVTAILGTIAMLLWAWLAHAPADKFPPISFSEYVTVLGLLAGVLLHTL